MTRRLRRDVESLLNESDSDTGFLGRSALVMAADVVNSSGPHIEPGESIGGYQVQALLGAGGMGDVYRARDAKLGRDVAIKILPRAFTSDPDRLARFEREARALAALNHPNVCAIYGVEEAAPSRGSGQAARFLILELVEGETLADLSAGRVAPCRAAARRRAGDRAANRGRARGRARQGDRPSRPQAREHQDHAWRCRQGARLRVGKDDRSG